MRSRPRPRPPLDVVVVGAGQAGLAMGRELERRGLDHLILDGAKAVGDSWRARWRSLRLFTPAAYSSLRGVPFPAAPDHHPTKDEVADYLAAYARAFSMPIGLDEPVRTVRAERSGGFVVVTDYAAYRTRQVVVATGGFQRPLIPAIAATLGARVTQLHSADYRDPSGIAPGPVVVVGGGASGVQIARELAATHDVTLAVGARAARAPERILGRSIFHWLEAAGAMRAPATTWIGRRMRRREVLIGDDPARIARRHGVRLVDRIVRAEGDALRSRDGALSPARTVIWCTGFRPDHPWLDVPVLDGEGRPQHRRGITRVPGMHFLGLPWQHSRGSALLGWVADDAEYLGDVIEASAGRVRR